MKKVSFLVLVTLTVISAHAQVPNKKTGMTGPDRAKWFRLLKWSSDDYLASDPTRFPNAGFTFYKLGRAKWLVEIITGAGAYQRSYVFALLNKTVPNYPKVKLLRFTDYYLAKKNNARKEVTSELSGMSSFNEMSRTLTIFYKGSGLGHCGSLQKYEFVGDRPRIIEARLRSCENATNFPPPEEWPKIKLF